MISLELFAWIVPLCPLLAFTVITLGGYRNRKFSHTVAILGVLLSIIFYQILFWVRIILGNTPDSLAVQISWISLGTSELRFGTYLDASSSLMLFVVPVVCLVIFVYSIGYMRDDKSYSRFFAYISLFAFAMMGLVLCDNLLALFIFWEIMGTCSYLLIGFWYQKPSAQKAALKAFIVTKVGDILMLLGLLILYSETDTLAYRFLFQDQVLHELASKPLINGASVATVVAFLLFAGTIGKSAQFPLHVWLPDAMEGPTPASALIHAATMVSAGIYLLIRVFPLLVVSQALPYIALIGTFTAVIAAVMATVQDDIKRVLAYSTISQLGYMVAAVGIGAYKASLFHLMTHAFFKALLFMAAGSVIHSVEHGYHIARGHAVPVEGQKFSPNSMLQMGGLRQSMPVTALTYVIGGLALAGFPFITSGFWSKDAILTEAWHLNRSVFWALALAAGLTAFYTVRQLSLVFLGTPRSQASSHTHENGNTMIIPLLVLALFSITVGWVGIPGQFPVLGRIVPDVLEIAFESPSLQHIAVDTMHSQAAVRFAWAPVLLGIALPALGLFLGWMLYGRQPLETGDEDPISIFMKAIHMGWLYRFVENGFYINEVYQTLVIRPICFLAEVTSIFDTGFIDWLIRSVGRIAAGFSIGVKVIDENVFDPDFSKLSRFSLSSVLEWIDTYLLDEIVNIFGFISNILSVLFQQLDERVVDGFVKLVVSVMESLGGYVRRLQNGLISDYLWNAFLMVLFIIAAISFLQ